MNGNGSTTFVLYTSSFTISDQEMTEEDLEAYGSPQNYRKEMSQACFKSLTDSMETNGFTKSQFFQMNSDEPTKVDIEAYINFMDQLLPNLLVGSDMLVCIPGVDSDGRLDMNTTFSLCFHWPELPSSLPLLGLVHNDQTTEKVFANVEGNYYFTSNDRVTLYPEKTSTINDEIFLCKASDFFIADLRPAEESTYRSLLPADFHIKNYQANQIQTNAKNQFWETIKDVCEHMSLPSFTFNELYTTNLVMRDFAKDLVSATLKRAMPEKEGEIVLERIKRRKLMNTTAVTA
jgi:hypothetical protein